MNQLQEAEARIVQAREAFDTATTRKARLEADEDLTFWQSKRDMLESQVVRDAEARYEAALEDWAAARS